MAKLDTDQERMVKDPIYPTYHGQPTKGRVVVFVPPVYDFTQDNGDGIIEPFKRENGKRGIVVAMGEDDEINYLLMMDKTIEVGVQCKAPEHPGIKDVDKDGNEFFIHHHFDILITYPNDPKGRCIDSLF